MCPPTQCCCCDLHSGVKIWAMVFVGLNLLGGILSLWGALTWAEFCEDETTLLSPDKKDVPGQWDVGRFEACYGDPDSDEAAAAAWNTLYFNCFVNGTMKTLVDRQTGDCYVEDPKYEDDVTFAFITCGLCLIGAAFNFWGWTAIGAFDAKKVKEYWQVILAYTIIDTAAGVFIFQTTVFDKSIQLGFALWWVYAVKSLADQLASGTITAQNPRGDGGSSSGVTANSSIMVQPAIAQATIVGQQPVMAQATIVGQQPVMAQATIVGQQPVMASGTVMAKAP